MRGVYFLCAFALSLKKIHMQYYFGSALCTELSLAAGVGITMRQAAFNKARPASSYLIQMMLHQRHLRQYSNLSKPYQSRNLLQTSFPMKASARSVGFIGRMIRSVLKVRYFVLTGAIGGAAAVSQVSDHGSLVFLVAM